MSSRFIDSARVLAILLALALGFVVGCKKDGESIDQGEDAQTSATDVPQFPKFETAPRSLSDEKLASLGETNSIPTEFVYPGAYCVQAFYPQKFSAFEKGASAVEYLSASGIQIPIEQIFAKSSLVLHSKGFSFEPLKNAQTDEVLQDGYPSPVEAVYMESTEDYDQSTIVADVFKNVDESKFQKTTIGATEAYVFEDTLVLATGNQNQAPAKIEHICAGLAFPSSTSVLFFSGTRSAFDECLAATPGDKRGVAAQLVKRAKVDEALVACAYEYDFATPNAQIAQLPIPLTEELVACLMNTSEAFAFTFADSPERENLLNVTVFTKSEDGANETRKALGSAIMQTVDALKQALEKAQSTDNPFTSLVEMLKSTQLSSAGDKVLGAIANTPENRKFFEDWFDSMNKLRETSETMADYQGAADTLSQLGIALTRYARENGAFPATIRAADGTPLLSWRVAMLPIFGEKYKALYDQFKLDEPWNSENNLKLLDQMPPIFSLSTNPELKNKTRFLVFDGDNTPFGKAKDGLKLKDVADPYKTVSVVYASQNFATEWTKPEEIAFNPTKPTETFGKVFFALTVVGEVTNFACEDTEECAKKIAALIYGAEDSDDGTEEKTQESTENATDSATEAVESDTEASQETAEAAQEDAPVAEPDPAP